MRSGRGTILNFTLLFGEKVLKDYYQEIVYPAFFNQYARKYGKTEYLILYPQIVNFGTEAVPDNAIVGRFVKNTILESEQVLAHGELKSSRANIPSAPSSTFALMLKDHRLAFIADTAHAPSYQTFEKTILHFVKKARLKFINREFIRLRELGRKILKKELEEIHKKPTLKIYPMASEESVEKFVSKFETLQSVNIKFFKSNQEIEPSETIGDLKDIFDKLNGRGTLSARNNEGLNKEATTKLMQSAVNLSVEQVKASGLDNEGAKLVLDNEDFKVEASIEPVPPTSAAQVSKLLAKIGHLRLRNR